MEKVSLYLKESFNELQHHVTWPTRQQLIESTLVVIATALILATIIFVMDAVFSTLVKTIYNVG